MTPPPINIDGTNENYSNVTIDGQDVEQITIDGQDVLSPIPDAVDHRWRMAEGSGSTLADAVGSVSATLNGGWTTGSRFTGGAATTYNDANNDNWITDTGIAVNTAQATATAWTANLTGDDFGRIFNTSGDPATDPSDGWDVDVDFGADPAEIRLKHFSNGSFSGVAASITVSDLSQDIFWAITLDGNSGRIRAWDSNNNLLGDASGSEARGTTASETLVGMGGDGFYLSGTVDDPMTADKQLTDSELATIRSTTSR
jgi:hypothetical protein